MPSTGIVTCYWWLFFGWRNIVPWTGIVTCYWWWFFGWRNIVPSTGIVTCYWWLFFWLEKHSAQYWYCNMLLVVVFLAGET